MDTKKKIVAFLGMIIGIAFLFVGIKGIIENNKTTEHSAETNIESNNENQNSSDTTNSNDEL